MTGLIPQSLYDELRVESDTYRAAWLKAERIWQTVKVQADCLREWLGEEDYNALLYDTERLQS